MTTNQNNDLDQLLALQYFICQYGEMKNWFPTKLIQNQFDFSGIAIHEGKSILWSSFLLAKKAITKSIEQGYQQQYSILRPDAPLEVELQRRSRFLLRQNQVSPEELLQTHFSLSSESSFSEIASKQQSLQSKIKTKETSENIVQITPVSSDGIEPYLALFASTNFESPKYPLVFIAQSINS